MARSSSTTLLVALLSLGIGIFAGFGVLYQKYQQECATLLDEANAKSSTASSSLQKQYHVAQGLHMACVKDQTEAQRACQQQQREAADTNAQLQMQHDTLKKQHQEVVEQLTMLEKTRTDYEETIQNLQTEIQRLQQQQRQYNPAALAAYQKQIASLTEQLQLAQTMLAEKMHELEKLEEVQQDPHNAAGSVFAAAEALAELKRGIQRQHLAQTVRDFPISTNNDRRQVEFQLDLGGGDTTSLIIELSPLSQENAMTTSTFLKMVQAGLYDGTTIPMAGSFASSSSILVLAGGDPKQATSRRLQATLTRQYAERGYAGMEPFLWQELSESKRAQCARQPGAFWFATRAPQFQLAIPITTVASTTTNGNKNNEEDDRVNNDRKENNMNDDHYKREGSCLGHVVQGLATLQQILQGNSSSEIPVIVITHARVIMPADNDSWNPKRDEL